MKIKLKLTPTWGIHWDSTHNLLFIFILPFIGLTVHFKRKVKLQYLPEGYAIQHIQYGDGLTQYRVTFGGISISMAFKTRQEAMETAWRHYNKTKNE